MRVTDLKTNHLTNPLGFKISRPVFSYIVEDAKGKKQKEARIRISKDKIMQELVFDSGFTTEIDSLAYQVDFVPEARKRYFWDVAVRSDAGEEACSEVNWFETGKQGESWLGKWITCRENEGRHPVFYTDIKTVKPVKYARLYLCGLGLYEAMVSGKKISDEYLTPYCNDYHQWLQYQTYDVTEELKKGGRIEVLLGNGWYKGRFGFSSKLNRKAYYSNTWKLIGELHLVYEDGTHEVIGTNEKWKVQYSKILASSIYDGETRDDTLPEQEPEYARICTEPMSSLTERLSTPVTVHEILYPVKVIHTPKGETVLDIGQNIGGIFQIKVHEPEGARIRLQFGEILQEGNFYRDNLRTAKAEYNYRSDGKEHVIRPHFTYYGYRYVKIEGIHNFNPEDFAALVIYSEIPDAGILETGHPLVNQLVHNTEWGMKGNFIDVPTDCPQRDERMGWTGDAQVFSATACYLKDCYAFYRKYLFDMWQEQKKQEGLVPNVIPSVGNEGTSAVWGDAACIIPWNLYLFYGDKTILEEQYDSMKAWVDYVERTDGSNHQWREKFHFGDWLALDQPESMKDMSVGATDTGFIADVYFANSAEITARTAEITGREKEAVYYRKLAERIREGVQNEYYSPSGRCCADTQTGCLLTLRYDVVPDRFLANARSQARKELIRKIEENGYRLQTGFTGTPLLCNQLSEEGLNELAYILLLNEEYPGWLYEIKLGATTVWERWNSVLADGTISSTGMNSLNHYAYGSIVEWLFRHCAGISPVEKKPGFRAVRIQPSLSWKLHFCNAELHTAAGKYCCRWDILDENHVEIKLSIPFGCRAEVNLPLLPDCFSGKENNPLFDDVKNGICYVEAGEYHVIYKTKEQLRKWYSLDCHVKELMENPRVRRELAYYLPWTLKIPVWQWDKTLRQAAERYGDGTGNKVYEKLESVLNKIDK